MTIVRRLLAPIVEVRPEELRTALLMFAYSFAAMTAYNIVQPGTRSAFITDLGADNLPYGLLAAGRAGRRHDAALFMARRTTPITLSTPRRPRGVHRMPLAVLAAVPQ